MTLTETNPRVDRSTALEILAGLEFDPELPCEHQNHGKKPWHEGPGELLIQVTTEPCQSCGWHPQSVRLLLCRLAYQTAATNGLICASCWGINPRDLRWQLVGGV